MAECGKEFFERSVLLESSEDLVSSQSYDCRDEFGLIAMQLKCI